MSCSHSRRRFLQQLGAAIVALHAPAPALASVRPPRRHRLAECELATAASIEAMRTFYGDRLGMTVAHDATSLAIRAGDTRIRFVHDAAAPAPFYHFAFNIPENKIRLARDWQAERSPLLPIPERNRAAGYPPEVVDYSHWNAHSIFFLDPAGNVVEYIARHDLKNAAEGPFTPRDILCTSEIALIVEDVIGTAETLRRDFVLPTYRGASGDFTALGDEHGLLLVMRRGRILDFNHESQEKAAKIFPTRVRLRAPAGVRLTLDGFPYEVTSV
jgi:hypothetical protein